MPPKTDNGAGRGDRVGGEQRDLARRAEGAEPEAAAGGRAQAQLVEEAEAYLGVGKDHLEIVARDVLEQLQVDVVVLDHRAAWRAQRA